MARRTRGRAKRTTGTRGTSGRPSAPSAEAMQKQPQSDSTVWPDQRARALVKVKEAVSNNIGNWANIVAPTLTDERFDRFREHVTEALHRCMLIHIIAPNRTYKRAADVKKDFRALAKAAIVAAKKLYDVEGILNRLPPMYHNPAFRLAHPPFSVTFELEGLAEEARRCAEVQVDCGGDLQRMEAFRALVQGLEQAVQHATGKPVTVTWSAHRERYEREFFGLVEIICPTVREIAEELTGRPLQISKNANARGKFLQRAKALSPKDKTRRK
jgi:hypothetical protein